MKNTIFDSINLQTGINFRNLFDSHSGYVSTEGVTFGNLTGNVSEITNSVYLWLGGPDSWTNENDPDRYLDNISSEIFTRNNITALLKLEKSETCLCIPRHDWTFGIVYDEYSETDDDLFSKTFYVMTSSNNVYKCLSNNNGAASTKLPIGTSTNTIILGDGYQWKFMYNLDTAKEIASKFLITEYIPTPFEDQKSAFQIAVEDAAVYSSGSPPQGHGKDASLELGAGNVIISKKINISTLGFNITDHRQFGLIINPTLISDNSVAVDEKYHIDSNNDINLNSGRLVLLTNHQNVIHTGVDTETIQVLLNF